MYTLSNNEITIKIAKKGAELKSLVYEGREYMWQADPAFWGRTAPVLFPIVGSLKDKEYTYAGQTYTMGQHGFARDMEFALVEESEDSISLVLVANEESRYKFPFEFSLVITYTLVGKSVRTEWKVNNPSDKDMHFSIGGHPGFNCPLSGYSYHIYETEGDNLVASCEELNYYLLNSNGTVNLSQVNRTLDKPGVLPINQELFKDDALVFTDSKVRRVALADETDREILAVDFDKDCSIFGLWSPAGKNAEFACIEPWYGTADYETTDKDFTKKANSRVLKPSESFVRGYTISVM